MNFVRTTGKTRFRRVVMDRLEGIRREHPGQATEFTLDRLCDLVQPKTREELALTLGELIQQGKIKQVIRVESPKIPGAIKDFGSLNEVPQFIHDWRTDREIEVSPDDLVVLYVVPA